MAGAKPRKGAPDPKAKTKLVLLLVGIVLLLGGCVAFYVGLKPLAPLMELFTGGAAAAERNQEFMDSLDTHLGNAALPVGLGFVGLMAGIVLIKMGLAPPKPKSMEELVAEEVERRLAKGPMSSPGATTTPASLAPPPAAPVARATPASAPAAAASAAAGATCRWCSTRVAPGSKKCPLCGNRP